MHTPVLLKETLQNLRVRRGGLYIDATVGEGGHFKKILEEGGKVLGIDRDMRQIAKLKLNFKEAELVLGNFAQIEHIAKAHNFYPVDGILFDLGLSFGQIEKSGRGFSYKQLNDQLDMRIGEEISIKASDLINSLNKEELYEIFANNSEEINSGAIAQAIVSARRLKKLTTVEDLVTVIEKALGQSNTRVLSRIWQALRIEVNQEFDNLKMGLKGSLNILKPGGRAIVITFHSLEDRIVKQFIDAKKSMIAEDSLIRSRSRTGFGRSAKLRIIVKNSR